MIIDVDIGNTRLKWRLLGYDVVHSCLGWEQALLHWGTLAAVTRVRVSSVINKNLEVEFASQVYGVLGLMPEFAQVEDNVCQLQLAYRDIGSLGVDRWLAMLAVRAINPGKAWMVLCAGTALTVDFLCRDGRHLGGYIVPGLQLTFDALDRGTAKIGKVPSIVGKNWGPAGSTEECVQGGVSVMYQAYLHELWRQARDTLEDPCVAWSGGGAVELTKLLEGEFEVVIKDALALDGLAIALP